MKFIINISTCSYILINLFSCTKFVQVPPPTTELVGASVYGTNATAASSLNGIYITMTGNSVGGNGHGISALLGLSADEFSLYPTGDPLLKEAYTNLLGDNSSAVPPMWADLFNCLYQANSAIEGITNSTGVTSSMKNQLIGEATFIRAFCHFYLANIYGDVPIVTTSNYKNNEIISRSPIAQVYQQVISDLKQAQILLSDSYFASDGSLTLERVRPNKATATALLSRVFLYTDSFPNAETEAGLLINNSNYNLASVLDSVFLTSSTEAIWQLEMPDNGSNTPDAEAFLLSAFGGPNTITPFVLSDSLVAAFEVGDLRRSHWVDSIIVSGVTYYFPYKYKLNYTGQAPQEYPTIFRLSEQYLIRAEARANENDLSGASADLNAVRIRAGLDSTIAKTQPELLDAILKERRVELFTEYGHRWLDLKRTNTVNSVMPSVTAQKGGNWMPADQLYPIPQSEIQSDPNLKQNPGYN